MNEKSRDVLNAADRWLAAIAVVRAADEARRRSDFEQEALDYAEVCLATTVMDWRDAGCPDAPLH